MNINTHHNRQVLGPIVYYFIFVSSNSLEFSKNYCFETHFMDNNLMNMQEIFYVYYVNIT